MFISRPNCTNFFEFFVVDVIVDCGNLVAVLKFCGALSFIDSNNNMGIILTDGIWMHRHIRWTICKWCTDYGVNPMSV